MIDVSDQTSYLTAVVEEFQQDTEQYASFELRKKLWHSCVVVCEVTETDYKDWHLKLSNLAIAGGISPREVMATVKSACRKAGVQ